MEMNELNILPDQLPHPVQRDRISSDLLRSSTIESLISQNEDLMARLKVTLRRLALIESDNQRLSAESLHEKQTASQATDRLLVMKEKDNIWKHKVDELETSKSQIQEKLSTIESAYQIAKNQVDRLQKYHDRVRNHVKPFVQELKKYSKSLEAKNHDLQTAVQKNEAQLSDLRHQVVDISNVSKHQIEILEQKNWQVTEHFENLNLQLTMESYQLKDLNTSLSEKVDRLQIFKERADYLENENIELRRRLETSTERHHDELQAVQDEFQAQSSLIARLQVEHQDAKDRLMEEFEQRKNLEKQVFDLRHQLDSLRFMWNAKNDENEKLRQAQGALEKLNVGISAKLQELRKTDDEAQDSGI